MVLNKIVSLEERVSLISSMKIWPGLQKQDLEIIARNLEIVDHKKGDIIMKEGEQDGYLYLVHTGSVDIFKTSAAEKSEHEEVKLLTIGTGGYIGAGSMLEGTPHSATVIAAEPTKTFRLAAATFKNIIQTNPNVSMTLMKNLSTELRQFRSQLVHVVSGAANHNPKVAFFDFKPHEQPFFAAEIAKLEQTHKFDTVFFPVKLNKDTVKLAQGCVAVCVFVNDDVNGEVVANLSVLGVKMIALRCAGFNNVDLKVAQALNISVARVPAYSPYAVAEHAVALLMAINRKIPQGYNRYKQGNFSLNNLVGFDLHGKTVGVIGTGKIGQIFVKIMLGFGCKVLLYDVYKCKELEELENCKYVEVDEVLMNSKVISLHVPLLPTTKYMINAESIAKMQKGAILINTSRGQLIKTPDLIEALKTGHIGGAGLDVYEDEQSIFFEDHSGDIMTDDVLSRLMTFPNVIVTGHQAFLTEEALVAISQTTMTNIGEYLDGKQGKQLTNAV